MEPINRLISTPSIDDLVPKTDTDHLLPEELRPLAERAREEFAALGREMDIRSTREVSYTMYYAFTLERIAAGMSQDAIRAELASLAADGDDALDASIARDAAEDALAGRPPQFKA